MFCKKCGTILNENNACPNCGYVLEGQTSPVEEVMQPQPPQYTSQPQYAPQQNYGYAQQNYGYAQQGMYYAPQEPVKKKSNFPFRAWFVPVVVIVYNAIMSFITSVGLDICNEIYTKALYNDYDNAYLTSIGNTYSIIIAVIQLIVFPLVSFAFYHLAFINVDKKLKRASISLFFVPFLCDWLSLKLSGIISSLTGMWANAGLISYVDMAQIVTVVKVFILIGTLVIGFFVGKTALGRIEKLNEKENA